ncbi:MAG TPA: D-glycero-beta-D-manno-heptose 1-phosphate adenylyltransferase [Caulobacteraceae bacterium]
MDLGDLQNLLNALSAVRVLAVGDLMVDRFVYGEVSRLSAEAPIAVLAHAHERVMLGAVGNVARNIAALGGKVRLVGVIGDDSAGGEAVGLIRDEAAIEDVLIVDPSRPTTVKTRFVGAGQQLLRVDMEEVRPIEGDVEARLIGAVTGGSALGVGAILLSDYGKGSVTPAVIAACLEAARSEGAPLIVDSKADSFAGYGAVDLIKPNAAELARATGMPTASDTQIEAALARALERNACKAILVTRSAKGMSLAVRGQGVRHFARAPAEVFDTSGAGDTALAAVGLALASGAAIDTAVEFALLASSVVVQKVGTATVAPTELIEAEISLHRAPSEAKIATAARMALEVERWRGRGLKIGFTNGCFDILHPGHIAYLGQARAWCDRLIVAVNSDRSVRALKGEGRPVNNLEARSLVLAALACVDLVVPFDEDTPLTLIDIAAPDILVKGGDYTPAGVVGHEMVIANGGEVRITPLIEGHSTTGTIRRLAESG